MSVNFTLLLGALGVLVLVAPLLIVWRMRQIRRRREKQAELAREQSDWLEISDSRLQR